MEGYNRMAREVMCSEIEALICAMRDPGTTGGNQICRICRYAQTNGGGVEDEGRFSGNQ